MAAMTRTAVIAGATGLVGGYLLRRLLEDATWDRVVSLGRRSLSIQHPKLEQRVVDFSSLAPLQNVADVFCCLGTTIKKAGSQQAFIAVDHDAVVALARAALAGGAQRFLLVSSIGAAAHSRVFYYRVKGETERDVAASGIPTVVTLRPSMLDGDRLESRSTEKLALSAMRLVGPLLGKYRPTHADDVAKAMVARAKASPAGFTVVEADQIQALAR